MQPVAPSTMQTSSPELDIPPPDLTLDPTYIDILPPPSPYCDNLILPIPGNKPVSRSCDVGHHACRADNTNSPRNNCCPGYNSPDNNRHPQTPNNNPHRQTLDKNHLYCENLIIPLPGNITSWRLSSQNYMTCYTPAYKYTRKFVTRVRSGIRKRSKDTPDALNKISNATKRRAQPTDQRFVVPETYSNGDFLFTKL